MAHTNRSPGAAGTASGAKRDKTKQVLNSKRVDYRNQWPGARELAGKLGERIEALATCLLGEPSLKGRFVWRWGAHGSLAVNVGGDRRGRWSSFEEGRGGDALDLVTWKRGGNLRDAIKWARNWLGGAA